MKKCNSVKSYNFSAPGAADGLGLMHRDRTRFTSLLVRDEQRSYAQVQQRQDRPHPGLNHKPGELPCYLPTGRVMAAATRKPAITRGCIGMP
jgi:hypothetical protein